MSEEKSFSNIMYMTSACQLSCRYCYEAEKRKQLKEDFWITEDQVKEGLDFFKDARRNRSILFFGGEPLLAWDKIKFAVKYVFSTIITNDYDRFYFNIITNGIRLSDDIFFEEYFNFFEKEYPRSDVKLEISYDGSGQADRVFPDGSPSKDIVLKAINKLDKNNKEFYLRYTLTEKTYDVIEKELIYLFEKYKNLAGMTVNIASTNLDKLSGDYKKSVDAKRNNMLGIYEIYKKPICDFTCALCKRCHPTDFNMHYVPGIGNKISSKVQKGFDRWNPLVGESYEMDRYDLEGRAIGKNA